RDRVRQGDGDHVGPHPADVRGVEELVPQAGPVRAERHQHDQPDEDGVLDRPAQSLPLASGEPAALARCPGRYRIGSGHGIGPIHFSHSVLYVPSVRACAIAASIASTSLGLPPFFTAYPYFSPVSKLAATANLPGLRLR